MNRLFLVFVIVLLSSTIQAQYAIEPTGATPTPTFNPKLIKFGLKISPSIAWINVKSENAFAGGATMKFGIGASASYALNENLAIVSGINFGSFGGYMADSASLDNLTSKDYFTVNYSSVEIPLGMKLTTPEIKKFSYYIQGGVFTGFIISANEKSFKRSNGTILKRNNIMKDLTQPSYAGIFTSVGTRYTLTDKIKLFAEATYKNSLTSTAISEAYQTDVNHSYTGSTSIMPSSVDFSFGIEF